MTTLSTGAGRVAVGLGLMVGLMGASGCGNKTTTTPSATLTTENLTGTLAVLGSDSKKFTVNYSFDVSDASVTVTSLTTVAASTPLTTTIGVAFGTIAFDGSCAAAAAYTANAAALNQELVASGAFGPGQYCVKIFDSGTLTEPTNYAITLKHY